MLFARFGQMPCQSVNSMLHLLQLSFLQLLQREMLKQRHQMGESRVAIDVAGKQTGVTIMQQSI